MNYPHPVNISRASIDRLKKDIQERQRVTNGDGYVYKYDPDADSSVNASESMKMDAVRLKQSPTATDLANRARQ